MLPQHQGFWGGPCDRAPSLLPLQIRELDPEHLLYEGSGPGPGETGPPVLTPLKLLDDLDNVASGFNPSEVEVVIEVLFIALSRGVSCSGAAGTPCHAHAGAVEDAACGVEPVARIPGSRCAAVKRTAIRCQINREATAFDWRVFGT